MANDLMKNDLVLQPFVQQRIFTLRGQQVMIDRDLAALYGVETRVLNQAVKRNAERFPAAFHFQLSEEEHDEILRSQTVISSEHGLIDNYVDDSVLVQLDKRRPSVSALVLTRKISKALAQDLAKHNQQYPAIDAREFADSHDRFLVLDGDTVYHLGASLKDLGKKWFAFSKMEKSGLKVMERLGELGCKS